MGRDRRGDRHVARPRGYVSRCGQRGASRVAWVLLLLLGAPARAGLADVVAASADCVGSVCTFAVTVRHEDTGWAHYANAWQILSPDGVVLATRVLRHPHVEEQPFTRELRSVRVPAGLDKVRIRARDSVHGYGGKELEIELPGRDAHDRSSAASAPPTRR